MRQSSDLTGQVTRSVVWVSFEKWGSRVISLVVFAILGRLVAPHDFGLVALCAVFTSILSLFVDSGFSQVLIQRATISSRQIATAFWTSNFIAVAAYVVLVACAKPIAAAYGEPRLAALLCVLGLQLPITALGGTPSALLERSFEFRSLTLRQLSGVVVGAVAGTAAAIGGMGVWALVVQSLVGVVTSTAVLWWRTEWRPTREYSWSDLKDLGSFGISILGTDAINLINSQADKLVVGSVLGPTALGYYYVGSRITGLLSDSFTSVIATVSLTTFSKLQHQPQRLIKAYNRATLTSSTIALPAFAASVVLAPFLIPALFGDNWGPSVLIMQLLAPASALNSMIYFDKSALLARGFGKATFLIALSNMLFGLVLVLAASPWGGVGVAISRSVRQFAFWPVRMSVLRRCLGLQVGVYLRQFIRPVVASAMTVAVMLSVSLVLPSNHAVQLLVVGSVGIIAYFASIFAVARTEVTPILRSVGLFRGRNRKRGQSPMSGPDSPPPVHPQARSKLPRVGSRRRESRTSSVPTPDRIDG